MNSVAYEELYCFVDRVVIHIKEKKQTSWTWSNNNVSLSAQMYV